MALVGSMQYEIDRFESDLVNRVDSSKKGIRFSTGTILGQDVVVMSTGGGKVNAAIATTLLCEYFSPASLIFTGVGGALNPSLKVGDVVIGRKTQYHDFGEIRKDEFLAWTPWNVGTGTPSVEFFPADEKLFGIATSLPAKRKFGPDNSRSFRIVDGVIATGDIFCASSEKKKEIFQSLKADVIEMDGAAVANVCWHYQTPCLIIRGISDLTNDNAAVEYRDNNSLAIGNAVKVTREIISEFNTRKALGRAA